MYTLLLTLTTGCIYASMLVMLHEKQVYTEGMCMAGINLAAADEEVSTSYGLLDDDDYRVRIDSIMEVTRDNQYAKRDENGKALPTFDIILKPLGFADAEDTELVDDEGQPVNPEKHLIFFFDPHRLGTRPQVSRSRKFLAAALGVAPTDKINLPGGIQELIGKELIVSVTKDNGKNKVVESRPIRRRQRVRVAAPEAVVDTKAQENTDPDEF
jgi:hypothetical protein